MNLFQKYGIKEVADVVFYSITRVGDEEIYTPVLFLDTLKVSTIEKTAEKVAAEGGKGNKKLITWNFGKEITLNLEDALFTPASMSLIWGGELDSKLSPYSSAIVKLNIANKYGQLHYSIKAYPSPALTDEEWEIVFRAATDVEKAEAAKAKAEAEKSKIASEKAVAVAAAEPGTKEPILYWSPTYSANLDEENIAENRENFMKQYFLRHGKDRVAVDTKIIDQIITYIDELKKIGTIENQIYDVEHIDRFEKCIVTQRNGLVISTKEQKENLLRYYKGDDTSSYIIYYDAKTMLPLLSVSDDGVIKGWDADTQPPHDRDFDGVADQDEFRIKFGTVYYKFTRTVKFTTGKTDGILGRTFVINADTFPDAYKIVGETYVREQKTGKDQRCQFVIHRAKVSSDTNITLEAEGDPTTFSMSVDVLAPPNDIMMELKQYDVDEDKIHGGTRIVPQKSRYTYTPTTIERKTDVGFDNPEIY